MPSSQSIFKLSPGVQSYDWGKVGSTSLAAQFAESCVEGFHVDEGKTYAELWMGTHPTLPSKQASTSTHLKDIIASDPDKYLSKEVADKFAGDGAREGGLPFLFKVLSIGKALSIQAHPDKKLAERLFRERPEVYKDGNHKPEMAIALTPFKGFCGFLPLPHLLLLLVSVPEMSKIIGSTAINALASAMGLNTNGDALSLASLTKRAEGFVPGKEEKEISPEEKKALRGVFEALMTASPESVKIALDSLISRYESNTKTSCATTLENDLVDLVLQLNGQYPGDIGILCTFVLNVVELGKGEAVFLRADEPHAYISGDIIECMATSDNVVRAGLTPKLRDVPTLISMLTYQSASSSSQLLKPTEFAPSTLLYDPPIEEFSVAALTLRGGESSVHRAVKGPSVVIVTDGQGTIVAAGSEGQGLDVKRGEVLFIAAGEGVEWKSTGKDEDLILFRAFCEA